MCKYFFVLLFCLYIRVHFVWYFCYYFAVSCLVIFWHYLTFFIKAAISLWLFFFSNYFSSSFLYSFFDFVPYFIYIFTSLNSVFCIFAVTYLIKSSSTSFVIQVTNISFISLFLIFSLLVIFSLILAFTKIGLILIQQLSYFSHHKHFCSVFCRPIHDLSGYTFCHQVITRWPCECPYVVTMASNFGIFFSLPPLPTFKFAVISYRNVNMVTSSI